MNRRCAFGFVWLTVISVSLLNAYGDTDSHAEKYEPIRAIMDSGTALMQSHQYAEARPIYEKIVNLPEAPVFYKSLALLRIASSYKQEKNYSAAQEAYRRLQSLPDAPPHHRWEADAESKSLARIQAGLPPYDPTDSRVKLPKLQKPDTAFYISVDGNDANSGSMDHPFAALPKALDAIAELKNRQGFPKNGVAVYFRQGVYHLKQGIKIPADISGRADAPVLISAYPGESVRLSGGIPVANFQKVDDPKILNRLPEETRDKVLAADLKSQGITDYGKLAFRGFGCGSIPALELYCNGKPMTPARWPNEGFVRTGKVLDPGSQSKNQGGLFEYDGDRPNRWRQAADIWLYGYWYYDWADNAIEVAAIDTQTRQIQTKHTSLYGMREKQPYYAFNLLEEIDKPGEWYLDRAAGRLYFYPPADADMNTIVLSGIDEPLMQIDQASYLLLQNLTFEFGRGNGIAVNGGDHCLVQGCNIQQLGTTGITINGGHDHGVLGCDIHTVGRGGTVVIGGERKTLTPGKHFVENCHIYNFSRIDRTYTPAVQLEGVGNRIAHNRFHDTPCHAMRVEGNDHSIEFNEIHDVVRESDDQGGLDIFLNPSYRGNIFRYNYWHDIGSRQSLGQAGIRLDDAISGVLIYGNVFYRCSVGNFGGVQIHGGKDNWVDNNIFVDCRYGISFSPWGKERWLKFLADDSTVAFLSKQVDITQPPYSTRYPDLNRLSEGNDVNWIWRNIAYRVGDFLTRDRNSQILIDNYITQTDPGFVDFSQGNFQLKEDSPVYDQIGFRPIPFAEIGLYQDEFRHNNK